MDTMVFLTAVDGDKAFVTGDEAAHLTKVMRLKPGDCVTLTDGAGFDYKCTAKEVTPQEVIFHIREKFANPAEPKKQLTVFMALPKSDKLEFICQKSCELGAVNFVPFVSEFCVAQKSKKDECQNTAFAKNKRRGLQAVRSFKAYGSCPPPPHLNKFCPC